MTLVDAAVKELDESIALMLVEPSSKAALKLIRTVDVLRLSVDDNTALAALSSLHDDAMELQDVVLTLETDPEMVKRNMLARVISGVFPVLNTIEEFRSFEDKGFIDLFIDSMGVVSEVATATQYLESTRLSSAAHLERNLVKVEARFIELAASSAKAPLESALLVQGFMDDIRMHDLPTRQKVFLPFLLWMIIIVLSYKKVKENF